MSKQIKNNILRLQRGSISMTVSAVVSAGVVLSLFLLMKTMITKDFKDPGERKTVPIPSIIQEKEEIKDELKKREIKEIDEPDEPPPDIPEQELDVDINLDSVNINVNTRGGGHVNIGLETSFSDGDLVPIVAIQPNYPRRAQERGTEGYVVVHFTIATDGSTKDIIVMENASLQRSGEYKVGGGRVFEREAIKAASRLRYKPRVVDGKPVEVYNYPYKFSFNLSE